MDVRQEGGALVVLNAVVTTAGGTRAMDIPRVAISFLSGSSRESFVLAPDQALDVAPTLAIGLTVGCTIVMWGLYPVRDYGPSHGVPDDRALRVQQDRENQASQIIRDEMQYAPASLAQRELDTAGAVGRTEDDRDTVAGINRPRGDRVDGTPHPDGALCGSRQDPLLAEIISSMQASSAREATTSLRVREMGLDPCQAPAEPSAQLPQGEERRDGSSRMPTSGCCYGEAGATWEGERPGEDANIVATSSGNLAKVTASVEEESDVADDQWRRLCVTSSLKSRQAAARRRPKVRSIPRGGPVILAPVAGESGEDESGRGSTGDGRVGQTRLRGRKRPREFGGENRRHNRFDYLRSVGSFHSSPGKEDSWSALRRVLHERYREFEEREAAEEIAFEASRSGGGMRPGGSMELMGPGLRVFLRQEHAFVYVDAVVPKLVPRDGSRYKVLSFETNSTGSRKFLVCDFKRFEEHYPFVANAGGGIITSLRGNLARPSLIPQAPGDRGSHGLGCTSPASQSPPSIPPDPDPRPERSMEAQLRFLSPLNASTSFGPSRPFAPLTHVYEIIREGSPCRMYFDLEFSRIFNDDLDGEALVQAWINVVAGKLHQDFGVSVGRADVLDLDSSTPKKFSRHLILHLPGDQLFEDNSHVGRFVNSLAEDLEVYRPRPRVHCAEAPHASAGEVPHRNPSLSESTEVLPSHPAEQAPSPKRTVSISPTAHEVTRLAGSVSGSDGCCSSDAAHIRSHEGRDVIGALRAVNMEATVEGRSRPAGEGPTQRGSNGALQSLWVRDGDGRLVLFADVSVYTRNRCFRLPGSSKFGKAVQLKVAATNRRTLAHMQWMGGSKLEPRDVARTVLHDALVVPAELRPEGERYLRVGGEGSHRYSRFGSTRGMPSRATSGAYVVRGSRPMTIGEERVRGGSGSARSQRSEGDWPGSQGHEHGERDSWRVDSSGFGSSPFPAVDKFLSERLTTTWSCCDRFSSFTSGLVIHGSSRKLICRGGVQGDLRQWTYSAGERRAPGRAGEGEDEQHNGRSGAPQGARGVTSTEGVITRLLTHQVAKNRWCYNIGRAHKSNHVFLVTDLIRGEVRQHCHDQDCRRSGFRSVPVRLPPEVIPSRDVVETYELEVGLAIAMQESSAEWQTVT